MCQAFQGMAFTYSAKYSEVLTSAELYPIFPNIMSMTNHSAPSLNYPESCVFFQCSNSDTLPHQGHQRHREEMSSPNPQFVPGLA